MIVKRVPLYIILFFYLVIPISGISQNNNVKFEHLGIDDGFSQGNVSCIIQGNKGFMWFGTSNGLNKYDGYKYTVFENKPNDSTSLSHNKIRAIDEDKDGVIWIATFGGGLSRLDPATKKVKSYRHDKNDPSSICSDFLSALMVDSDGNLWLGSNDYGLDLFDRKNNKFVHFTQERYPQLDYYIRAIYEDSQHNIWLGDSKGLVLFDRKNLIFTFFRPNNSEEQDANLVQAIVEGKDRHLWLGTRTGGLYSFDTDRRTFKQYVHDQENPNSLCHNNVLSLAMDSKGDLWIGTENGGLNIMNTTTETFENYKSDYVDKSSLSNNSIWSLCKDAKGNMWVGTYSGGINFYNRDAIKFKHHKHNASPQSLSNNNVLSLTEDADNNLWIGTDGGGLNMMDQKTGIFKHFKHDPNNKNSICGDYVLSVMEDSEHNLWIGTWGDGLTVYNRKKNTYRHYKTDPDNPKSINSNNAWTIFEDADKDVWIGAYGLGISLYDKKEDNFINFRSVPNDTSTVSGNAINVIVQDAKGYLWIGTNGHGLNRLDKKTKIFKRFEHDNNDKNSLSGNVVHCLFEDSHKNLWVGTDLGVNKLNTTDNSFKCYHIEDGLPGETVGSIQEDDRGNLWIGTNKGLSKFDPVKEKFFNFTVADGLQSYHFKSARCKSRSGKMYFGGINGFNEFIPDSVKGNSYDPPLVLTDLRISNESLVITNEHHKPESISNVKEITLSHDNSMITIEFAALNYTIKQKKQYAYLLEGFDKEWNYCGMSNTAVYTNLDPAKYTFRVKCLDNDGNWSKNQLALGMVITPPYWQTWWFKILMSAGLLGFVGSFFWFRFSVMKKQKQELEIEVSKRTKELALSTEDERMARKESEKARRDAERANQAKSVFLATMSHEIRTPMNGVIGMAALMKETSLTDEQRNYAQTISNCGENLLSVINNILDFSKIESGKMEIENHDVDLRNCIEETLDIFATKASETKIDLLYQMDHDVPSTIVIDGARLKQVLINLIGNAIKFTSEGEIYVGVHVLNLKDGDYELKFEIKDTGIGIPQNKLERLFKAFSQVDSSTTRKYGGTGLGLAISEKLVHLMRGEIGVESVPGQGTTFSFTIKAQASKNAVLNYVHFNSEGLLGKKILIVDDNETNLKVLKTQLSQWKFEVTCTSSPSETLKVLKTQKFDLLISDMQMPDMDGVDLAKAIRRVDKDLPIILLSSIGDETRKNHENLFSHILTKPVKQKTLFEAITSNLRKQFKPIGEAAAKDQKLSTSFSVECPLRILIAEDNPVNQMLAIRALHKLGYEPFLATNGLEATQELQTRNFDVILMDVQMPEMDGLQATRVIRNMKVEQPIIIAMTANAMAEDKQNCLQVGMDDYISKPFKLEDLVEMLRKWSEHIRNNKKTLLLISVIELVTAEQCSAEKI